MGKKKIMKGREPLPRKKKPIPKKKKLSPRQFKLRQKLVARVRKRGSKGRVSGFQAASVAAAGGRVVKPKSKPVVAKKKRTSLVRKWKNWEDKTRNKGPQNQPKGISPFKPGQGIVVGSDHKIIGAVTKTISPTSVAVHTALLKKMKIGVSGRTVKSTVASVRQMKKQHAHYKKLVGEAIGATAGALGLTAAVISVAGLLPAFAGGVAA
jgi:hypothetical protein